jgi:hypothetical protein
LAKAGPGAITGNNFSFATLNKSILTLQYINISLQGVEMNILKYFLFLLILIVFYACHSDLVTQKYETTILKNAVSFSIPELQNNEEIELIKKHKIKSVSYIVYNVSKKEIDSLTFVEYDVDGKILRRTTKENTTQGCLPYMMRQEFSYEGDRIKKVTDYTFKYVANSTLENWLLKDTTKLLMFDWEDYTYIGDTIIVESGFATHTYFKDDKGNIIKQKTLAKTNKQELTCFYEFEEAAVIEKVNRSGYEDPSFIEYLVDNNSVLQKYSNSDNEYLTEFNFDENGLLKSRTYYLNENKERFIEVNYSYY